MTKVKTGKSVDDIFASKRESHRPEKNEPNENPTLEAVSADATLRTSLFLPADYVYFFDRLIADMRYKTGAALSRNDLILGIVGAIMDSKIDLTDKASMAEIRIAVFDRLRI